MAKGDFYFPLFYKRLLSSTIGWKDDEFGAYVRLLIHQFDNGSIPNDIDELALVAPSIKKNKKRVLKKFKDQYNGTMINEVMDEIYHNIQTKKEKNKENGKKGGRKKQTERLTDGLANGNQTLTEGVTESEAILITNNKYQITKENTDPPPIFSIEHCLIIAMKDPRWVRANKVSEPELKDFNAMLERRGVYEKNPADYKTHYANWKAGGKKEEVGAQEKKSTSFQEDDNLKKLKELHAQ